MCRGIPYNRTKLRPTAMLDRIPKLRHVNMTRMKAPRAVSVGMGAAAVAATWHLASVSLASGALDIIPFTAPGALIGLGVGWLSFAAVRREFIWRTGLVSALAGAVVLPPWLGLLIAMVAMTTAGAVLLLVTGAWAAVGLGAMLALLRGADRLWRRSRATRAMRTRRSRSYMPRWRLPVRRGRMQ